MPSIRVSTFPLDPGFPVSVSVLSPFPCCPYQGSGIQVLLHMVLHFILKPGHLTKPAIHCSPTRLVACKPQHANCLHLLSALGLEAYVGKPSFFCGCLGSKLRASSLHSECSHLLNHRSAALLPTEPHLLPPRTSIFGLPCSMLSLVTPTQAGWRPRASDSTDNTDRPQQGN